MRAHCQPCLHNRVVLLDVDCTVPSIRLREIHIQIVPAAPPAALSNYSPYELSSNEASLIHRTFWLTSVFATRNYQRVTLQPCLLRPHLSRLSQAWSYGVPYSSFVRLAGFICSIGDVACLGNLIHFKSSLCANPLKFSWNLEHLLCCVRVPHKYRFGFGQSELCFHFSSIHSLLTGLLKARVLKAALGWSGLYY